MQGLSVPKRYCSAFLIDRGVPYIFGSVEGLGYNEIFVYLRYGLEGQKEKMERDENRRREQLGAVHEHRQRGPRFGIRLGAVNSAGREIRGRGR